MEKVSAVVFVVDIDGVRKRIHAINVKPMASPSRDELIVRRRRENSRGGEDH